MGIAVLALMIGVWAIHRKSPEITALVRSTAVVWIGRAVLLVVTARGLVSLIDDIDQVL